MCQETWEFGLSPDNDGAKGARGVRRAAVTVEGCCACVRGVRGQNAWAPSGASSVAVLEPPWEHDRARERSPGQRPGSGQRSRACGPWWVRSGRTGGCGHRRKPRARALVIRSRCLQHCCLPPPDAQAALRKVEGSPYATQTAKAVHGPAALTWRPVLPAESSGECATRGRTAEPSGPFLREPRREASRTPGSLPERLTLHSALAFGFNTASSQKPSGTRAGSGTSLLTQPFPRWWSGSLTGPSLGAGGEKGREGERGAGRGEVRTEGRGQRPS